jgi:hypothetical protein
LRLLEATVLPTTFPGSLSAVASNVSPLVALWRRFQVAPLVARPPVISRATMNVRLGVVEPRVDMRMVDAGGAAVATSSVLVSASQRDIRLVVMFEGWLDDDYS